MTYQFEKFQPEHRQDVSALLTQLGSSDAEVNGRYLDWKYAQNPYIKEPMLHVVTHNGRAVGIRGSFGNQLQVGSPTHRFVTAAAADSVVHPEHRGAGLFGELSGFANEDLLNQGHEVVFVFSAATIPLDHHTRDGCPILGPLHSVGRPLGPLAAPQLARMERLLSVVSSAKDVRVAEMSDLVSRNSGDGRFQHVRDATYYGWRFSNPLRTYRYLYWDDGQLQGFAILQFFGPTGVANLIDWEWASPQIQEDLLAAAIAWCPLPLKIWTNSLTPWSKDVLARYGFLPVDDAIDDSGRQPTIVVRPLGEGYPSQGWLRGGRCMSDINDWNLRMVYSDAY